MENTTVDAFALGNLLGRLVTSTLLVYLALLIFNRFDFKRAGRKLKGVLPILSIVILL